jgi:hypothetical protein
MLDAGCWWDVGVAEVSEDPEMQAIYDEHRRARQLQRFYYSSGGADGSNGSIIEEGEGGVDTTSA